MICYFHELSKIHNKINMKPKFSTGSLMEQQKLITPSEFRGRNAWKRNSSDVVRRLDGI